MKNSNDIAFISLLSYTARKTGRKDGTLIKKIDSVVNVFDPPQMLINDKYVNTLLGNKAKIEALKNVFDRCNIPQSCVEFVIYR